MRQAMVVRWTKWTGLLLLAALAPVTPVQAQATARQAGEISALLPVDHVWRGRKDLEAAKGMPVLWGDKIVTERGGRVRVRLSDSSILNVGSDASLTIEQHDTATQRTTLQLAYGRMRASVVRITQPAGGFQVRAGAAVAGVVGTDVFTEAAQIYTTVIALGGGLVYVDPTNPLYASMRTILNPGEAITIVADQRPGEKRLATEAELNSAFEDTEVDEVARINPRMNTPGRTFDATIQGRGLTSATGISFQREGLSMQITGPITATQIPVRITIAANVPLGSYPFTVQRPEGPQVGLLVVASEDQIRLSAAGAAVQIPPPTAETLTVIRGTKFLLDASATTTPAGTHIVAFIWRVIESRLSSNDAQFTVNTSLLKPGDYLIELAVVNDRGQTATQRFNLTVLPGPQPVEIIRDLSAGYESLQPNQFLKQFDEVQFRNYSGFASAIEDSFRNQLETVRVFQRPVNCTIVEEQDQAICQADFELLFTKKEQPSEFLDANGNPFPPGVPAPLTATPAKRLLSGSERTTIRFGRVDKGWKIVDYNAEVSCPGGTTVSGVNVGSCILALGSFSTPSFQILNLQVSSTDLFVGGTITGSFDVSPLGGFNGQVTFAGSGTVLGVSVSGTFTPNPAPSLGHVDFVITAPTVIPAGFSGANPFVFTITGADASGTISQSASLNLLLKGDFSLSATPVTSAGSPLSVPRGGLASFTVNVIPGAGFPTTGIVTVSIPNPPAGFSVTPTSANVPAGGSTVLDITVGTGAALGPVTLTVNGAFGGLVKTVDLFLDISPLPAFSLTQFTSPTAPLTLLANSSVVIGITATQNISSFTTPITLTFGPLPAGVTVTPTTATVNPGSTQPFTFSFTPSGNVFANFGVANITVTGTAAGIPVQTTTIVLNLGTAGALPFTLSASPSSSTVTMTSPSLINTSFSVVVSSAVTFNQPINIGMGAPPPGVSISPSTFVFTPGLSGSSVFYTVTVNPAVAQPGSYPVLVSGVSGGISATTTWTLVIRGSFSLSLSPLNTAVTPAVLPPDGTTQTSFNVTVTSVNNFAGSVTVSFSNPFGAAVTFTPGTSQVVNVAAGGSAVATFTLVAAAGAANTQTLSAFISASSTTGSALNSISGPFLTIGPVGFTLSSTSTGTVVADIDNAFSTPTVQTTVVPLGNFGASVDFTVVSASVPAGVSVSPVTQRVAAGGVAQFTLRAVTPAVVGNYSITVDATSGALPAQTFTINFRLRGQITMTLTEQTTGGPPGSQTAPLVLAPSGTLTFNVSVGGINGYTGSVRVQVFSLPTGVTGVFSSSRGSTATLPTPGTDTLTLTNVSASPTILDTVFVQADDIGTGFSSNFPSANIFITIGSPTFVLGCGFIGSSAFPCTSFTTLFLNINDPFSSDSLELKLDSIGGYSGTVGVVPQNLPAGVTMSPNPVILSPAQSVTVTFTAATPAVAGRFSFNLVGTDTVNPALTSTTPAFTILNGSIKLVVTPATSSTAPLLLVPGSPQTITVNVSGMNGFSGTADISMFGSFPTGVTISPSTTQRVTVPPTGSVSLTYTLDAAANTPASSVQNITFDSDGFDASFNTITYFVSGETSVSLSYVVGPSSFSTFVSGATLTSPRFVQVGQQTSIFITITPIGAFSGTVFLNVLGLPSGITVSSAPGSTATIPVTQGPGYVVIQPQVSGVGVSSPSSASATLFFTVASNAPRGFVQATLTATSGTLVQSIPIVFFITPQVTIGLSPQATLASPMVIAPGSSANLQISATPNPSFIGDVDLTFNLPTGVTITPVSARVSLGGFVNVTVNLASTVTAGSQLSFTINASINGSFVSSATANIVAGTGAFSIAVSPPTATSSTTPLVIAAGGSGQVGIAVSAIGAFTGSVTVSASFSVTSLTSPTPSQSVNAGQTANFTVNAAAGAQGLIARMLINASGGGQSVSATVFISIGSGGFSLTAVGNSSSSPYTMDIPSSTSFSVLVHQQSGFTGTVSLVAGSFPTGVSVRNNGFLVPAGTQQTFVLDVASNAAAGDTQFTVTGTSGTLTVNITVFLRLRGSFTMAVSAGSSSANPMVVAAGASQNFSVSIQPVASFFGTVQVSFTIFSLPAGVTITPASATAGPGAPASFTLAVAGGTADSGVLSVRFSASGTYAAGFPGTTLFYTIGSSPTFNMSFFNQLQVQIGNQFGDTVDVSLNPVGGYTGNVTLTVGVSWPGVTVSPQSSTVALSGFGTSIPIRFVASSATVEANPNVSVNITASDGVITKTQQLNLSVLGDFSLSASTGTNSVAPIVLLPGGSSNVSITMALLPPTINCQAALFKADLSVSASLPSGVTATVSPTADPQTPGTLTISAAAGAAATQVFAISVLGDNPSCGISTQAVTVFAAVGPGSFSISSGSASVNINSNSFSSAFVSVNSVGNFAGTVNISVVSASVPAGITVTPMTTAVTAGNSFNFQVRADTPATAGSASFNFTATDGTTTVNGTIPLQLRGSYTLTVTPANSNSQPAVVAPNQSLTYNVAVTPQNGFNGTVSLNRFCFGCGSPPPGVSITGSLTASPSTPGQIVVTASPTAVASAPSAVVFLSSSPDSFSAPSFNFFSAVGPPSFRVFNGTSVSFPQQVVIDGSAISVFVSVQSLGGFSGTVDLALGTLPAGLTASPQTAQVTVPAGSSAGFSFTFQAGAQMNQGPVDIQVTATQGTTTVSTFFYMYVASNMALVQTPQSGFSAPLRLLNGDPTGQTVTIQVLNQGGFTGSISLNVTSLPTGITATPSSALVPANGSQAFQFVATTASPGVQSANINASFSGISVNTAVFFNVGVGSYLMSTSPASTSTNPIALDPNGTAVVPIAVSIIPQNGFVGTVDITPSALPAGMTVSPATAQVVINSSAPVSTTFNFSATVAQGLTPVQVTFSALAVIATPIGPTNVTNSTSSFLLVNPPTFALTQSAGTSSAHISLEQGIPPGQTFQIGVTGTGTVNISFLNVPAGLVISPPTASVTAPGNATFSVVSSSGTALGNYTITVSATSGVQTASLSLFVDVVAPTTGFFLSTTPTTSSAAPVILQPDSTLITFLNVNVNAKGSFAGTVTLSLSNVPAGVTATLSPSVADLSVSPLQVVQLQFVTTTGLAPFAPTIVSVNGVSGSFTANVPVFTALQVTSTLVAPGSLRGAPLIQRVTPPAGYPGSHVTLVLEGLSLSGITGVMSNSPEVSAQLEPGGTDSVLRISVFVRRNAAEGTYTLMLLSPHGAVPIGFIVGGSIRETPDEMVEPGRPLGRQRSQARGAGAVARTQGDVGSAEELSRSAIRVEPASLKPGDVVEGRIIGENLAGVRSIRASGLGITVEVLESSASEVRVRFIVAPVAASGSRMLTLDSGGQTVSTMLQVGATPRAPRRAPAAAISRSDDAAPAPTAASSTAAPLDLAVRAADITMSPGIPRPGDSVTFRIRVTNRSAQRAENVEVEFSLGGTSVRTRERFTVDANSTGAFEVQWQAAGSGRFEPKVVIDPDQRLNLTSRTSAVAVMPAFEMAASPSGGVAGRPAAALRERGQMTLAVGGCQGFRFASGSESACNGGADVEVRVAPQGGALRIEAEGVRNLGALSLDQVTQVPPGALGTVETIQSGSVYLVQTRRGNVLLRVMDVRGMSAVRGAPAPATNRPRISDVDRGSSPSSANVTLVLEWRMLSQ